MSAAKELKESATFDIAAELFKMAVERAELSLLLREILSSKDLVERMSPEFHAKVIRVLSRTKDVHCE